MIFFQGEAQLAKDVTANAPGLTSFEVLAYHDFIMGPVDAAVLDIGPD
jgi:hypothetical protein